MAKRTFDIFISGFLLVVLSPVILAIVILVRLFIGSPVLFIQTRPGLHARPFKLVKFRTMTEPTADGAPAPDAARLTQFGMFLRSFSLDELPELWNVLLGDMSLVGPRPLLTEYLPLYSPDQGRRHELRPGITGWAQVNGRNALGWDDKFALDVWYVDNRTFRLDLWILLMTLLQLFGRHGISADGHATMPRFRGTQNNRS